MLNVANAEGVQLQSKLFRGFGDPARLNIFTGAAKWSHDCVRNCCSDLYEPIQYFQPSALPARMRLGCC